MNIQTHKLYFSKITDHMIFSFQKKSEMDKLDIIVLNLTYLIRNALELELQLEFITIRI